MAYNIQVAERLRKILNTQKGVTEKAMFGPEGCTMIVGVIDTEPFSRSVK